MQAYLTPGFLAVMACECIEDGAVLATSFVEQPAIVHESIGSKDACVGVTVCCPVSYTHLTLPTNREV